MIPAEAIAEAKARHDIVSFIEGQGVPLKRAGEGYLGLCPFHEDRSPSLSVSPRKQYWSCLGACSSGGKVVGGDVIEFARRLWGVGFKEALEKLGARTTVSLPPPAPRALRAVASPRRGARPPAPSALGLLAQAVAYWHQVFVSSPKAREYAATRGLTTPEFLAALPAGYSDGSLAERAPEGSETHAALRALGLLGASGREHFSGCLVIPLRDLSGAVVGVYGRRIEGEGHVYLPGPRRGLVNAASAATADELILTESVIDALSFLEAGLMGAVPLYGTNGFTLDHEALLEKHRVRKVALALDADEAGRKAALALAERLRAKGLAVRDVVLPAKDPNRLLVAEGPEGFRETWKRLTRETATTATATTATVTAAASAAAETRETREEAPSSGPAASAAKQENLPALSLDESGTYVLSLGLRTYRVRGLSVFGVDRLRVNLRVEEGARFHVDTFDLYSARGRAAFVEASVKALRLGEGGDVAGAASLASDLDQVISALEKERLSLKRKGKGEEPKVEMSAEEREEALAFLKAPDLVERLKADFEKAGCVGEETALLIGYLAALSRKLEEPLSVLFCARSGAGKSNLQERLCELVPPEDLVRYTRITGQALFYKDEDSLVRKLLAIDEEEGAAEAAYSLRNLQSGGHLTVSATRTDPQTGKQKADDYRVNGPTSIFLTTARPEALDYETRNRFVILTVDESKEQTRRILERQRWAETLEGLVSKERKAEVVRRHHAAQRLLLPLRVVNPFAPSLPYPSDRLILRREQKKYLTLIKAVALLHQHQRPRRTVVVGGKAVEYVEASEKDVEIAGALAPLILRRNLDELSPPTRSLLVDIKRLVAGQREARGTRGDVKNDTRPGPRRVGMARVDETALFDRQALQKATGLSYWHLRVYLEKLVEYEHVAPVRNGQGRRVLYELVDSGLEDEEDPAAHLSRKGTTLRAL